jgi:hypothetical protein
MIESQSIEVRLAAVTEYVAPVTPERTKIIKRSRSGTERRIGSSPDLVAFERDSEPRPLRFRRF